MLDILKEFDGFFGENLVFLVGANLLLLLWLFYYNRKIIWDELTSIPRNIWAAVFLVCIISLLIRIYIPPHQHILYIDEAWYTEAGKNILLHENQLEYPKSIGWPFVLSVVFGIFGISNMVAIYASMFFGAISGVLIFLIVRLIVKNEYIAVLIALVFAMLPVHIRWSATAETNVTSLFFVLLSVLLMLFYYKKKDQSLFWLSAAGMSFAAQFRPENYALVILFLIGAFIFEKKKVKEILYDFSNLLLIVAVFAMGNLAHTLVFQFSSNWIVRDSRGKISGNNWSLDNLINNSIAYSSNLFNGNYYSLAIVLLAAFGIVLMFYRQRKFAYFFFAWFVINWLVYFTSWFQTLGGRERFYLSFYPSILIFTAYGINECLIIGNIFLKSRLKQQIFIIAFFLLLIFLSFPFIKKSSTMNFSRVNLLETMVPDLANRDIPINCFIVANMTSILNTEEKLNVVDIDSFLNNDEVKEGAFRNKCLLFFKDFTCSGFDKKMKNNCDRMQNEFSLSEFKSYNIGQLRYIFYSVSKK